MISFSRTVQFSSFCAVLLVAIAFSGITAQSTTTTGAQTLPAVCGNCTPCVPADEDPLTAESVFTINTTGYFNRYTFRLRLARDLGISRYHILDKKVTRKWYAFTFSPTAISKAATTGLSAKQVCDVSPFRFLSLNACCLHTNPKLTDAPISAEDAAAEARNQHKIKLIVAWCILGVTTLGVFKMIRKDQSANKDVAMDSAMDLAEQKDDDEE